MEWTQEQEMVGLAAGSEATLRRLLEWRTEQERTKQQCYRVEQLDRSIQLLQLAAEAGVPARSMPALFHERPPKQATQEKHQQHQQQEHQHQRVQEQPTSPGLLPPPIMTPVLTMDKNKSASPRKRHKRASSFGVIDLKFTETFKSKHSRTGARNSPSSKNGKPRKCDRSHNLQALLNT